MKQQLIEMLALKDSSDNDHSEIAEDIVDKLKDYEIEFLIDAIKGEINKNKIYSQE